MVRWKKNDPVVAILLFLGAFDPEPSDVNKNDYMYEFLLEYTLLEYTYELQVVILLFSILPSLAHFLLSTLPYG